MKARKSGSGVVCPDWPPEYADQEGGRNSKDKRHDLALIRQVYVANHGATAIHVPQTNRRVRDSCYHSPRRANHRREASRRTSLGKMHQGADKTH